MSARETPTVAEVVRRAVEICDPGSASQALDELEGRYEDNDAPITAVDLGELLAIAGPSGMGGLAPEVAVARAVIIYLVQRPDRLDVAPLELLHLAAGAEFGGHPPAEIANWLEQRGVT